MSSDKGIEAVCPETKSNFPQEHNLEVNSDHKTEINNEEEEDNGELGVCNFVNNPTNPTQINAELIKKPEEAYVHPMVKRSTCALSLKSLETCTEYLGSETGSSSSEELIPESTPTMKAGDSGKKSVKNACSKKFPPPLTFVSGSGGLQMRPRREGGRLVIEAVKFSPEYFQAERKDGRLKLMLLSMNSQSNRKEEIHDDDSSCDEDRSQGEECFGDDMEGNTGDF